MDEVDKVPSTAGKRNHGSGRGWRRDLQVTKQQKRLSTYRCNNRDGNPKADVPQ